MINLEPTRSAMSQSRQTQFKSTTHRIEISSAPHLEPRQLAKEFAAMVAVPSNGVNLVIIRVDNRDLIYIMPKTGEVVRRREMARSDAPRALAGCGGHNP